MGGGRELNNQKTFLDLVIRESFFHAKMNFFPFREKGFSAKFVPKTVVA